eukprot:579959-Pleurochrysis_carterae.AAC.1
MGSRSTRLSAHGLRAARTALPASSGKQGCLAQGRARCLAFAREIYAAFMIHAACPQPSAANRLYIHAFWFRSACTCGKPPSVVANL